jgi:hypothetical protein
MKQIELAVLLGRRKELQEKVEQLRPINVQGLFETKMERRQVNESYDDIKATVPIVSINQITRAYDHYARRLRQIDAKIQQANWTTLVEVDESVMEDFRDSKDE